MQVIIAAIMGAMLFAQTQGEIHHVLVTSDIVRVATIAAKYAGYRVGDEGTFLEAMRMPEGQEPYSGYASIALYAHGHPVYFYSIRIETGDVLDATNCKVFRYPELLVFKKGTMRKFGTKAVSVDTLASEVGCTRLQEVPAGHAITH